MSLHARLWTCRGPFFDPASGSQRATGTRQTRSRELHTPRVNADPPVTRQLVNSGVFQDHPFCLVDVGASGGIDQCWEVFGKGLCAFGFDGLVKEIERLNAASPPAQRYFPLLVGDRTYRPPGGVPDTQPFPRTSAASSVRISGCDYAATYFDQTHEGVYATEMIELDQFFLRDHPADVDFIKVDTDGSDFQVLRGARELLSASPVLGIAVESQFHGFVHDDANLFRNIDRLLTTSGFSLFDLEVYRYSRAALPKPFVYRIPAQTEGGQVLWGDALYLRDAGKRDYESEWNVTLSASKVLKLSSIFEIFGLEDCAAELLLKYRDSLIGLLDVEACLDMLTPLVDGKKVSYRDYQKRFEQNPSFLYPNK